jgi:DNA-binding NarL/FixJ family response regulator
MKQKLKLNIAIIENNEVYRESLKTLLGQVPDFEIVFDTDRNGSLENFKNLPVQLVLLDYDFGKSTCNEIMNKALSAWPTVKFLLLTNFKEEFSYFTGNEADLILKNSSKKEFEHKIRKQQSN